MGVAKGTLTKRMKAVLKKQEVGSHDTCIITCSVCKSDTVVNVCGYTYMEYVLSISGQRPRRATAEAEARLVCFI